MTAPLRARVFGAQAVAPPRRRMQSVFLPIIDDDDDHGTGAGLAVAVCGLMSSGTSGAPTRDSGDLTGLDISSQALTRTVDALDR